MKYNKLNLFILAVLIITCCFTGCNRVSTASQSTPPEETILKSSPEAEQGTQSDSLGSRVYNTDSVSKLVKSFNTIVIAEYSGKYEKYGKGNGALVIRGKKIDDNSYYAMCKYKVITVIKGNKDLEGSDLTVNEYLGSGEYVSDPISNTLDGTKHLLFMDYNKDDDIYSAPYKDYCVHLVDDKGNITYTTTINESDKFPNIDDFKSIKSSN